MQFYCNLRCCSADKSYLIVDICNLFQTGTLKQEQSEGGWRSGRGLIASPSLLFKILSWWSCQCHSLSNSKGVRIQIKKYISCAFLKVHHRPLARFFLRASCSGMRVNPELCGSSYQIRRPPTLESLRQKLLLAPDQHQSYQPQISERRGGCWPHIPWGGGAMLLNLGLFNSTVAHVVWMMYRNVTGEGFEEGKGNQMITKAGGKLARCNLMYIQFYPRLCLTPHKNGNFVICRDIYLIGLFPTTLLAEPTIYLADVK